MGLTVRPASTCSFVALSQATYASHYRTSHLYRTYENGAPVNDVVIHPNQGELISCDQAGVIRQWDLSENSCTLELVRVSSMVSHLK